MRKDKGVITAFFAIIMGIVIALLCSLIDFTRINSSKNQLVMASDAAITSALANYNKKLYEDYGLLSFEHSEDIDNIIKEMFQENIPENGLFDISVNKEDILIKPEDNIFLDNELMKKQIVNSMMYKGTENLAMDVFQKVQQFLSTKNLTKDQETLKALDKKADTIDELIAEMQEGKASALELTALLAKNQGYNELINKNIGYITDISHADLKSAYKDSQYFGIVETAINHLVGDIKDDKQKTIGSVNNYTKSTDLLEVYSYAYAVMVLEMYEECISKFGTDNDKKNLVDIADAIKKIKEDTTKDNRFSDFATECLDLFDKVSAGAKAADELIKNEQVIKDLIAGYENKDNFTTKEIKEVASESAEKYKEILEEGKLEQASLALNSIKNSGLGGVPGEIFKKMNNIGSYGRKKIVDSADSYTPNNMVSETKAYGFYDDFNIYITVDFIKKNKNNSDKLVRKICEYSTLPLADEAIKENQDDLLVYVKNAYGNSALKGIGPRDKSEENIFVKFYKRFKEMESKIEEMKKNTLTGTLSIYKDNAADKLDIDMNKLPSNAADNTMEKGDVSEQMDKAGELDNLGSINFDNLINTFGSFVDKVYIVEYVMTNFKDMVDIKDPLKRIPEETGNATKLNYEIEAIISGKYDDEEVISTLMDEFFTIRLALNTVSLLKLRELKNFITTVSGSISAFTLGAVPEPVARYIIVAIWALIETNFDLVDIYNGYQVPILKESLGTWVTDFGVGDFNNIEDALGDINNIDLQQYIPKKNGANAYNKQNLNENENELEKIGLNYVDMLRFKLLISNENKIIDRVQDLIVINKDLIENYEKYNSALEVGVNKSKVNILFTTDAFKSKGGEHEFNGFSFKRGYN